MATKSKRFQHKKTERKPQKQSAGPEAVDYPEMERLVRLLARAMKQPEKLALLVEAALPGIRQYLRPAIRKAGYRVVIMGTVDGLSVFTISLPNPR
jgi:hypothetical protein